MLELWLSYWKNDYVMILIELYKKRCPLGPKSSLHAWASTELSLVNLTLSITLSHYLTLSHCLELQGIQLFYRISCFSIFWSFFWADSIINRFLYITIMLAFQRNIISYRPSTPVMGFVNEILCKQTCEKLKSRKIDFILDFIKDLISREKLSEVIQRLP